MNNNINFYQNDLSQTLQELNLLEIVEPNTTLNQKKQETENMISLLQQGMKKTFIGWSGTTALLRPYIESHCNSEMAQSFLKLASYPYNIKNKRKVLHSTKHKKGIKCKWCGSSNKFMKCCCYNHYYCSTKCQKMDWKSAKHQCSFNEKQKVKSEMIERIPILIKQ